MKKYIHAVLRLFVSIFMLVLMLCCSRNDDSAVRPKGSFTLQAGISVAVENIYSQMKAAQSEDFRVIIYSADGEQVRVFDNYSEMPERVELEEGEYYVEMDSENNLPAAFENDYYFGSSENFSIRAGTEESVEVNCSLANIRVTVVYSETVSESFEDYSTTVTNSGGSLIFSSNEIRAGYFNEGPLSIEVNLEYTDAAGETQTKTLTGSIAKPQEGHHYEIQVDATADSPGTMGINVVVDESYETEIVEINDHIIEGPVGSGDLLITELMFNPTAKSDTDGEFIEIVNTSESEINLNQVVIYRLSSESRHVINEEIVLASGSYAVLARSADAAAGVDYIYGSAITLPNGGEEIQLRNYGSDGTNGSIICRVDYGSAGFPSGIDGASIQLSNDITDAVNAGNGLNWCVSTVAFSTGDLGTPGSANEVCP